MLIIILCIATLVVGIVGTYFILRPRLVEIEEHNEQIEQKTIELETRRDNLLSELAILNQQYKLTSIQQQELLNNLDTLKEQAKKSTDAIYDTQYELMQEHLSAAAENIREQFLKNTKEYESIYLTTMTDSSSQFSKMIEEKKEELAQISAELADVRAKASAAIDAYKREEEKQLEQEKYKVIVSDLDLLEINRLREIAPYFRNARPVYKIIWESYYRNQTTELLNRVVGETQKTGIYKITNLKNQKSYIGQAVNVANRFKEHIKCGLGIDTPNNKLYSALMADGVENFTFEVIEECPRDQLNDREIYWINYYKTQDFGYNMTKGGARK